MDSVDDRKMNNDDKSILMPMIFFYIFFQHFQMALMDSSPCSLSKVESKFGVCEVSVDFP